MSFTVSTPLGPSPGFLIFICHQGGLAEATESKVKTVMGPVVVHGWGNRSVGEGSDEQVQSKMFQSFLASGEEGGFILLVWGSRCDWNY